MKWTIDKSRLPSFVRVNTNGDAKLDDLRNMWSELIQSDFWQPGFPVLIDNRKLKQSKDPGEFTSGAIDFFAENKDRVGPSCIAALGAQPVNFTFARQFQYGIRLKGSDAVLQIFGTEAQALDWLEHYCQLRDKQTAASARS